MNVSVQTQVKSVSQCKRREADSMSFFHQDHNVYLQSIGTEVVCLPSD